MRQVKLKVIFYLFCLSFVGLFSVSAKSQEISFDYYYKLEMSGATEAPQIGGFNVDYPEAARKNGVEGTLKATLMLGENGKTRDVKIVQELPFGVTEAVLKALQNMSFQPARKNGQPVSIRMSFDFVVTALYGEGDKNIIKPKILEQPDPVYPANYAAEKLKGKVQVIILFYADGNLKVLGVSSVMPKEFDKAALEATSKIKFQPAVHKKSKAPVSQKMTVEYDFKP